MEHHLVCGPSGPFPALFNICICEYLFGKDQLLFKVEYIWCEIFVGTVHSIKFMIEMGINNKWLGWLVGCIEDLRRLSGILAISRLGSGR